jgi:hypothetical protein
LKNDQLSGRNCQWIAAMFQGSLGVHDEKGLLVKGPTRFQESIADGRVIQQQPFSSRIPVWFSIARSDGKSRRDEFVSDWRFG